MTELWNWRIDGGEPVEVYPALAEALGRVVMPMAVADPVRLPAYAVVCDVWEAPGLYGTVVDCYGRVVMPMAVADPVRLPAYAVVCDVWEAPGLYGT
ncbi:hypothetical protein DRA43_18080, partial [Micromonospora provocatoris]